MRLTAAQRSPHLPQVLIVAMPVMVLSCSVLAGASLLPAIVTVSIYIYCVAPHIHTYTVHHCICINIRMELAAVIMTVRRIWNHVVARHTEVHPAMFSIELRAVFMI